MVRICTVDGCRNLRMTAGTQRNGNTIYRSLCEQHFKQKREMDAIESGFSDYNEYSKALREELAKNEGYENATERRNAKHPYRWALKTFCENVDSRLGFRCTTTILLSSQLEVDHIDGNPSNNHGDNLQTLCGCCHTYKTLKEKDYLSPGRKALGLSY